MEEGGVSKRPPFMGPPGSDKTAFAQGAGEYINPINQHKERHPVRMNSVRWSPTEIHGEQGYGYGAGLWRNTAAVHRE